MIDPDLCQRLAAALGNNLVSPEDRQVITDAALKYETWDELPPAVRAMVEALEGTAGGDAEAVTASSSVLYAGHAHELYGLDVGVLPSVYGLPLHDSCDPLSFCRNPLHPGPCKGWKHTLKAVAPGVHAMIERDRLARVEERRKERAAGGGKGGVIKPPPGPKKSRKGQGDGRDGDGDGLKGEGKYEKKGREKGGDPAPPTKQHAVTLSPATKKAVAAAVKALPKDDSGWRELSATRSYASGFDKTYRDAQVQYIEAIDGRERSRAAWAMRAGYGSWYEMQQKNRGLTDDWERYEGPQWAQQVKDSGERQQYLKEVHEAVEQAQAAQGGRRADGRLPEGFVLPEIAKKRMGGESAFVEKEIWTPRRQPRDASGNQVVSPELTKMHAAVQKAGEAIHADIKRAIDADPEVQRFRDARGEAISKRFDGTLSITERKQAQIERQQAETDLKKRERELVMDALGQLRPMGGGRHFAGGNVRPILSRSDLAQVRTYSEDQLARSDWEAQLEETDKHLPTAWVRRSAEVRMSLVSTPRAYHKGNSEWKLEPRYASTVLAMDEQGPDDGSHPYSGAFPSYSHEVTYHEMGHRMESTIPGITALEFAYVRSKTTHNGTVEPRVKLKDLYGGGYTDREETFKDQFPNAYTGKTYESSSTDSNDANWEAFQVGLQQTVGRHERQYGDDTLEHFVLGVLATVGR